MTGAVSRKGGKWSYYMSFVSLLMSLASIFSLIPNSNEQQEGEGWGKIYDRSKSNHRMSPVKWKN